MFFVALATSLSHNGILIRDLVQILVGEGYCLGFNRIQRRPGRLGIHAQASSVSYIARGATRYAVNCFRDRKMRCFILLKTFGRAE